MRHAPFLLFFASRDIFRRLRFLVLVVFSLAFAFLNLVFATSLLTGFTAALKASATDTYGHISITPKKGGDLIANVPQLQRDVEAMDNVAAAIPRFSIPLQVAYDGRTNNTPLGTSVDLTQERRVTKIPDRVWQGRFITDRDTSGVAVGKFLADMLEELPFDNQYAAVGDTLTVTFPNQERKTYTIVGMVDTKNILANGNLYFPRAEIQQYLRDGGNQADELLIRIANEARLDETKRALEDRFPQFHVATWKDYASYITEVIDSFAIMQRVIQAISLMIGAIISGVVIHIIAEQKRREIGILYSLGASVGLIVWLFIIESIFYSFLSILVGTGLFAAMHAYFQQHPLELVIGSVRTVVEPNVFLFAAPAFMAITVIAGLFPALRASRERITEVIGGKI